MRRPAMATFAALNLETDDGPEEEVDDTKEIQIEEALKLYQTALRLHSQGPKFYRNAAEAYETLFKSEIFRYPESVSKHKYFRILSSEYAEADEGDEVSTETAAAADETETTTSALPQTIYLSHKNYGQFLLDSLKHSFAQQESEVDTVFTTSSAIRHFADALERDDSDLELWRKCGRVGDTLKSYRISRFCLESVLDEGEGSLGERFEHSGIEQIGAIGHLEQIFKALHDKVSLSQLPRKQPKQSLFRLLRKQIDPFSFLPSALKTNLDSHLVSNQVLATTLDHRIITPLSRTWSSLGEAILKALDDDPTGGNAFELQGSVRIYLPTINDRIINSPLDPPIPLGSEPSMERKYTTEYTHSPETRSEYVENAVHPLHNFEDADPAIQNSLSSTDFRSFMVDNANKDTNIIEQNDQKERTTGITQMNDVEAEPDSTQCKKRSSTSITNDDPMDGGRTKSKRIRARESVAEIHTLQDEILVDQTRYFEDRLENYAHADEWMFSTVNDLLSKFGVEELGSIHQLRDIFLQSSNSSLSQEVSLLSPESLLVRDLQNAIENWNDNLGQVASQTDMFANTRDGLKGSNRSGFSVFLEHSKKGITKADHEWDLADNDGLVQFSMDINSGDFSVQEVAFRVLEQHLKPENLTREDLDLSSVTDSNYATHKFPHDMKEFVNKITVLSDEYIYGKLDNFGTILEEKILSHVYQAGYSFTFEDLIAMEMSQSLYELHLNIYNLMATENNDMDQSAKCLQKDRLNRWRFTSRRYISYYLDLCGMNNRRTAIMLRHFWSTTLHLKMIGDTNQDYVLECLGDIRHTLVSLGNPVISIVNNDMMPELSIVAIDQETSRLRAMRFFIGVFGSETYDPVHLIETIEPVLEPSAVEYVNHEPGKSEPMIDTRNLVLFLDQGDATLKLFLWHRLREAYESIKYPTKVVSCYLRSIETITQEFSRSTYMIGPSDKRLYNLVKWLKLLDSLLSSLMRNVIEEPGISFECFDSSHLQTSMSSLARLSRILQTFAFYDDRVRIGQTTPPDIRPASVAKSLEQFKERLRSMFVKTWIVQYTLLRENMEQNNELFNTPLDDRIHFLRSVHKVLGLRSYCKYSQKMFLKLMKHELLTLEAEEAYETDIAQVLFDLYGLKISAHLDISLDHGCPIEHLDQPTALKLVDFIMSQANRMNIKDFLKSELRSAVDTIQRTIGFIGKSSPPLLFNRRILSRFLKDPINPLHLFQSVQGLGEVSMVPAHTKSSMIAEKGWYVLLGNAALTKFQTQKKLGPTPTDDLDLAASFFRHDLEHGEDRWETWYRLAQVYDLKLEECIAWSADKLNNCREDLAVLERRAIHAYSMAVSVSVRTADLTHDAKRLVSELYTQFGFRMYASSREPLSMGAFDLSCFMRHFSSGESQKMYEEKPFQEMKPFSAWNFASYLFRKAMTDRPVNWMNHYMFGKCLWKMYCSNDSLKDRYIYVEVNDILDSFTDAVNALPKKRDGRSEPILEPHFKLVSIIHKLVKRGSLRPEDASERLLATPWGRNLSLVKDIDSWKPFVLDVLKNLRNADKSNWHHRIVVRAAHIIYDETRNENAALAAKNDLTQHIFTKTMTVQVWRPENERAGRHFVYTTRYVYFFVHLLEQLDDRVNLDMLIRRVRRKPNDYLNHAKLWEDICAAYIRVLRRAGNIPEGNEEAVFKPVTHDEFAFYSSRLDSWCQNQTREILTIELLREAVELKKLNGSLIKSGMFDDVVADIYARLYEKVLPEFIEQAAGEESRERMKVGHLLMTGEEGKGTGTHPSAAASGPKTRTKGVTRKELQRTADAIAARVIALRPASKPSKLIDEDARHAQQEAQISDPLLSNEDDKDGGKASLSTQKFVPTSIGDGAGESELGELNIEKALDVMKTSAPLFPNLVNMRASSPKPGSELSTDIGVDGGGNESALVED